MGSVTAPRTLTTDLVSLQPPEEQDAALVAELMGVVEDAEGLGDWLDAFVVDAGGGVEVLGLVVVTRGVCCGEFFDLWQQFCYLVLNKVDVVVACFVEALFVGFVVGDRLAGHGELRLADIRSAQTWLAGGEVVARHERDRQVGRFAGGDVLALGDDAQAVVGEQVKLRHLVAGVVDLERARAGFGAVGAHGAGVGVGGDLDAVGVGGVFHARRERQCQRQRGHGGEGSVV